PVGGNYQAINVTQGATQMTVHVVGREVLAVHAFHGHTGKVVVEFEELEGTAETIQPADMLNLFLADHTLQHADVGPVALEGRQIQRTHRLHTHDGAVLLERVERLDDSVMAAAVQIRRMHQHGRHRPPAL